MKRSPLQEAIVEVLRQGESLLDSLSDKDYTRKLPAVFSSTVGGHYRHCLDHFQSLLQGLDAGEINYDHRDRNPRIENDREFALGNAPDLARVWIDLDFISRLPDQRPKQSELRARCRAVDRIDSWPRAHVRGGARDPSLCVDCRDVRYA
jgi:hypothetical protein